MTKTDATDAPQEFASPESSVPRLLEAEVRFDQLVAESKRQAMRLVDEAREAARKRVEDVEAELQEAAEALRPEIEAARDRELRQIAERREREVARYQASDTTVRRWAVYVVDRAIGSASD